MSAAGLRWIYGKLTANGLAEEWQDLPPDSFVHGCLTQWRAYAVYEENICLAGVQARG